MIHLTSHRNVEVWPDETRLRWSDKGEGQHWVDAGQSKKSIHYMVSYGIYIHQIGGLNTIRPMDPGPDHKKIHPFDKRKRRARGAV